MAETFMLLLEIMVINLILSGDNAVVIAMAGRNLPAGQRKKAIWWGTAGAVMLRIVLTFAAVFLLKVPFIQGIGSLLLLYIAVKLLGEEEDEANVKQATSLKSAIGVILTADFVMSLDNVLAVAAAANGDMLMIGVGIALSIPMVVWGSTIIMKLLHRFPIFIWIGAGILGYTAGEMLVRDERLMQLLHLTGDMWEHVIPYLGIIVVLAVGWVVGRRRRVPEHHHARS